MNGFHVRPEHVLAAIESASDGLVPEGNVGGGTGMICHALVGAETMTGKDGATAYRLEPELLVDVMRRGGASTSNEAPSA